MDASDEAFGGKKRSLSVGSAQKRQLVEAAIGIIRNCDGRLSYREAAEQAVEESQDEISDKPLVVKSLVNSIKYRKLESPEKTNRLMLLTTVQEDAIAAMITCFEKAKKPMFPSSIIEHIRIEFNLGDEWDGWGWWKRFQTRNGIQTSDTLFERISAKRFATLQRKELVRWCDQLDSVMTRPGPYNVPLMYPAHAVYNIDETILGISEKKLLIRAPTLVERKDRLVNFHYGSALGSLLCCVRADGQLEFCVICLKTNGSPDDAGIANYKGPVLRLLKRRFRGDPLFFYAFSSTGMLNSALWKNVINKFHQLCNMDNAGLDRIVLLDNLAVHRNFDALMLAKKLNIRLFFLLPNCSHWLQPLDQWIFLVLKGQVTLCVKRALLTLSNASVWRKTILGGLPEVFSKCFETNIVKKSFLDTGVYPYSRKTIMARFNEQMGQTTDSLSAHAQKVEAVATKLCDNILMPVLYPKPSGTLEVDEIEVEVETDQVYEGFELADRMEAQQIAKDQAKQAKEDAREQKKLDQEEKKKQISEQKERLAKERADKAFRNRLEKSRKKDASQCRVCGLQWVNRGGDWLECSECAAYCICSNCAQTQKNVKMLNGHERKCQGYTYEDDESDEEEVE